MTTAYEPPSAHFHKAGSVSARLAAAAAVLVVGLLPASALAEYWFLGIGNDGYIKAEGKDINGLHTTIMLAPNWQAATVNSNILADREGSQILGDLGWLAGAGPGDLAVFFYSGHGSATGDVNGDELAGWAIDSPDETIGLLAGDWCSDDQIAAGLSAVNPAVPLVLIFDCCYAGGMVGGLDDLNSLPNLYVMMSSLENESSYGGDPYSEFTQQLVNGITPAGGAWPADANADQAVTLDEWFAYALANCTDQTPVKYDSGLGDLNIVYVPAPASAPLLAAGAAGLLGRAGRKRRCEPY